MRKIELFASNDGKIIFAGIAKKNTPLKDVCEDAEYLWNTGKATYVCVFVDGETYMELES